MNERQKLLVELGQYCFAAFETALFLDTHPDNKAALEAFNKYRDKAAELREQYQSKYGALTYSANEGGSWQWLDSPWPWE